MHRDRRQARRLINLFAGPSSTLAVRATRLFNSFNAGGRSVLGLLGERRPGYVNYFVLMA